MEPQFNDNLVLAQIVHNQIYRDKVVPHLRASFFSDTDGEDLFKVLEELIKHDKVKVLDRPTILLKYKNHEFLDKVLALPFPAENTPVLVKSTEKWAQEQALKEAIIKAADIIGSGGEKGTIGSDVREALAYSFDKNLGLNYKEDVDRRFAFYNNIEERISTGWDMLDYYTNGGLQKKTLTVSMGSSGLGKTLLGTNLTASLIRRGYRGLYVTLELAEEIISRRVDSVITRIPYYSIPREKERVKREVDSLKGNVWVREYPPSRASSQSIMNYLRELEIIKKEKFDFLVADYIQLMKPNFPRNINSYEKYKEVAEELREVAVELDIPAITFSQVQRSGYGSGDMGLSAIADSIAIVNTADLVIGMTQTPDEEQEGFQTWKIIKNRLGRKGVSFRMQMDSEILAFNQVINEEERLKLTEFRDRMSSAPNVQVVKEERPVTAEEEVLDYIKFVEESPSTKFEGFS